MQLQGQKAQIMPNVYQDSRMENGEAKNKHNIFSDALLLL